MNSPEITTYQNFIRGYWVDSSSNQTYPIRNPAHLSSILGRVQASVTDDVAAAVQAAYDTQTTWASTPAPERSKILYKLHSLMQTQQDDFARIITLEEGKPLADAKGEVKRSLDIIEYAAGEGRRMFGYTTPSEFQNTLAYTVRRPLGVVAIITPWNFPLAIPTWKLAPALVCGNTVVLKPASATPISAIKLAQLCEQAGLPPGVLNLVTGSGAAIGETLVKHPKVAGISFTGSTDIGTNLYTEGATALKKIQCEMGGKNAVIVLADADMDDALDGIVQAAFGSTGQRCTATSRVIVEEGIYESFMEGLVSRTSNLSIGDGINPRTDVGPAASESQFHKIIEYIELGVAEGATLVYGGKHLTEEELSEGYYVEPTIFSDVDPAMRIAQEEIFGPVLTVFKATNLDEAIKIANNVKFGLSSSIYCKDLNNAFRYIDQVEAGMVHVNSPTLGGEVHLPFGGTKASGVGTREQGTEAVNFFSEIVTVYVNYSSAN